MFKAFRHRFTNINYTSLLYAYILHFKLNLRWKAIFEVQSILSTTQNMMVRFTADVFVRQIQAEIAEIDIRKRETSQIDVVSLIDF